MRTERRQMTDYNAQSYAIKPSNKPSKSASQKAADVNWGAYMFGNDLKQSVRDTAAGL